MLIQLGILVKGEKSKEISQATKTGRLWINSFVKS